MLSALQADEVQLGVMGNPAVIEQVSDPLVLERSTAMGYFPFFLNSSRPPLDVKEVRQAISCAIDRQELIDTALLGEGVPTGPFVEGIFKTEPFDGLPCDGPDKDMARQLLTDAGFPDGFPLETIIITGENDAGINIAQNLQAQLAEIGVDLDLQPLETNIYVDRWLEADFDSALSENGAGPDPHHTYAKYFTSTGNFQNVAGLTSPELDQLFADGQATTDPEARVPIYNEISQILLDESPWVWLYQGYRFQVRVPELEGFVPHPTGSHQVVAECHPQRRLAHERRHRDGAGGGRRCVVPGAVALVRHRGQVVVHEAFGSASLPDARPMTPETVFDLASLTKPLVGATVDPRPRRPRAVLPRPGGHRLPAGAGELPGERGHDAPAARPHRRRDRVAAGVRVGVRCRGRAAGDRPDRPRLRAGLPLRVQRPRLHDARPGDRAGGRETAPRPPRRARRRAVRPRSARAISPPSRRTSTPSPKRATRSSGGWPSGPGSTSPAGARPSIPVRSTTATRTTGSVASVPTPACSPPPSRSGCSARCGCAVASATAVE